MSDEQGIPIGRSEEDAPAAVAIDALNELRALKLTAWLQYGHHAEMAFGLAMPEVRAAFSDHADQSEVHAEMLAERVHQLGGVPIFQPVDIARLLADEHLHIKAAPTLQGMVLANLDLERRQIRIYQPLIRQFGFDEPVTRHLLEDILMATEAQASAMQHLLSGTAPVVVAAARLISRRTGPIGTRQTLRDTLRDAVGP